MNKKQIYKDALDNHVTFAWYDFLNQHETAELRKDVIRRAKERNTFKLDGCNNKATVTRTEDGSLILTSYYTDVLTVTPDGRIIKTWDGYSATTQRHINKLMDLLDLPRINKNEWVMMGA